MRTVDLFAGCGGMSLGFLQAGFDVFRAYDKWAPAIQCYRENFDHAILSADLSDYKRIIASLASEKVDLIIGGPPCQDFSQAGKRMEGARATLTESFARIVAGVRPEWYVMENVERTLKSANYARARKILCEAGYGISEAVLDASYCGVPQKRKRFFSIGRLGEKDDFLQREIQAAQSREPMTLRDYFGDKLGFEFYYRHPRNYNRRGVFSIDEPAPTMRGVNRPIPAGYPRHPGDPAPVDHIRALTTAERAWIQTFPKDFKFNASKTKVEQLIGNAVPVKLAEFVGRAIMSYANK